MEPKYLIFLIIALVIIFSISISYIALNFASIKLIAELSKLNPAKNTADLINFERCTRLNKTEAEWVITGCKDDIIIHLIFKPSEGYYMEVCGGWANGAEVAEKAKDILKNYGITVNCDLSSITLLRTEDGINIYNVCERELYMNNGCIA